MGKRRNFTQEALLLMYENIDTNADGFWDGWDDFWNFEQELNDDLSNIDKWFGYILEAEDITKQKLDTILRNIADVETSYAAKFENSSDRLKELQKDLNAFFERIDESKPIMPQDTTYVPRLTPQQAAALTIALIQMYGPDATIDSHLSTPEQIAHARIKAEDMGIHLPLTAEQLAASEAAYQRIKNARENVDSGVPLDVEVVSQYSWASEFGEFFASKACYATCMYILARYYGFDITMRDLINNENVRANDEYGIKTTPYFNTTRTCEGASEDIYCQRMYDELLMGNPSIVQIGGHFVVAVGIVNAATAPYKSSDILVIDPAIGKLVTLEYAMNKVNGRRDFVRLDVCSP